ncbi:hypothetical protein [Zavarzinella formosa]|uniref:hypothetical protein n=1 Tax=Zavarzinella formosa TaxID=360055 RepID=UPI0002FAE88A|nr:hypothetical protein [Zavarzinella formosa]
MKTIRMTVKDGHWVSVDPADLPEGTEKEYAEREERPRSEAVAEDDWPETPEEIEQWIAETEAIPPLVLTPEEEADLLAWRAKAKAFNLEAVRRQMIEGFGQ